MSRFDEIKARHIQHEAILAQMRIDYADKNHKPIELLTNQTHKDRKELLDMVAKLEARLADRHQRMEDRMHERDTERHETDLRILALQAQLADACDKVLLTNEAAQAANTLRLKAEAQLDAVNWAFENRIQTGMDGDSWYATEYDFVDLQESESGWGDTPAQAIVELQAILKEQGQ